MATRMSIGRVLVAAKTQWQFHMVEDVAVARRMPAGGILRVQTYHYNDLAEPASHANCLALASQFAGCATESPYNSVRLATATGPFGSASFHRRRDFVRVWYVARAAGIIVGAYTCGWTLRVKREYRSGISECESMMASAIFNRPLWGANDILTQAVIEMQEEPEPDFIPENLPDSSQPYRRG